MREDYLINESINAYIRIIDEEDVKDIKNLISQYRQGVKLNGEFKLKYGFDLKKLMAYGDCNKVSYNLLKKIIPEQKKTNKLPYSIHGNYHCYAVKDPTIVLHEDRNSSWNCLLEILGNPELVLIYIKE